MIHSSQAHIKHSLDNLCVRPLNMWASLIAQLVKNPPAMHDAPVQFLCREDPLEKGKLPLPVFLAFPVAQLVKTPTAMWETWVLSLGWEDPLDKGKAIHSSILAWRIPWTVSYMGLQRVAHD